MRKTSQIVEFDLKGKRIEGRLTKTNKRTIKVMPYKHLKRDEISRDIKKHNVVFTDRFV